MKGIFPALILATLLLTPACGRKKDEAVTGPMALPSGPAAPAPALLPPAAPHGAAMPPKERPPTVVKDTQKAKWKAIKISILNVASGKVTTQAVPPGADVPIQGTGLTLRVDTILSDFTMSGGVISPASDTLRNPAAQVQLSGGGKLLWKGWMFKRFPDERKFDNDQVTLNLVDLVPAR